MNVDPKCSWALRNLQLFPVEINKAPYEILLRVPGIGKKSALKIVRARRLGSLSSDDLKQFRVVLKRARYFITCKGKYYGDVPFNSENIRNSIADNKSQSPYEQLRMF